VQAAQLDQPIHEPIDACEMLDLLEQSGHATRHEARRSRISRATRVRTIDERAERAVRSCGHDPQAILTKREAFPHARLIALNEVSLRERCEQVTERTSFQAELRAQILAIQQRMGQQQPEM
jgi:hypothetical protein